MGDKTGDGVMEEKEREFKVVDKRRVSTGGDSLEHEAGNGEPAPGSVQATDGEREAAASGGGEEALPTADFTTFMISMGASVMMHLGDMPDPVTDTVEQNLPLARHTIDTIEMLREKTRGNLTEDEEMIFENLLADLKMRYGQALS
ncbi:MAG: DUF1844 domain-containing protein [Thermodesulfobacteriota bacterium]